MPTYRIIVNGEPVNDLVTADTYLDAYFSASKNLPQAYNNDFKLVKVEPESK
ncbi:MAG: hypothetical protein ABFC57_08705 [Veillonellales bacterium]